MPTKILIGSVLKPVDDIRHYHKIAKSLAKQNSEIHIFGYFSGSKSENNNIIFHSSKPFKRLSISRIFRPISFFLLGLKLRPKIIICGTHELLKTSFYLKLFLGCKVIYDVRENYYKNIIHTDTFPPFIKQIIAWLVRLNESISSWMIDYYLLAEKCYKDELPFVKKDKFTIIENKYLEKEVNKQKTEVGSLKNHFMITGTLGEHYGTKEGIRFFNKIHKLNLESALSITGICRNQNLQSSILSLQSSAIKTKIDDKPIPHLEIIRVLEHGGIALLPYQHNKSTKDKIPTKFYEYLYYRIPMIVQKNDVWEDFLTPYKAAIFIDFNDFDVNKISAQIEAFDFYSSKEVGEEILWKNEEDKLVNIELLKS